MDFKIGATSESIMEAEKDLNLILPITLKEIWLQSNGLDYPNDWRIFPVFDKQNSRKSWGHIVEENKRSVNDYIPEELLKIASDSFGNKLVLKKEGNSISNEIFLWDHETNKIKKSMITLEKILTKAKKRKEKILKQIEKNLKKKKNPKTHKGSKPTKG